MIYNILQKIVAKHLVSSYGNFDHINPMTQTGCKRSIDNSFANFDHINSVTQTGCKGCIVSNFDHINPDLEDSNPSFRTSVPVMMAHHHSTWLKNTQLFRSHRQDEHSSTFSTFAVTLTSITAVDPSTRYPAYDDAPSG